MHSESDTPLENIEFMSPIEARREELQLKHAYKLKERNAFISDHPITEEEQKDRDEILALNPKRVKVICNAGVNRSRFVADILNELGYEADNSGAGGANPFKEDAFNKKYDAIIFVSPAEQQLFKDRIVLLNLTETVKNIPTRVLNFRESSGFYLGHEDKERYLEEIAPKIRADLDRLGFIDKK